MSGVKEMISDGEKYQDDNKSEKESFPKITLQTSGDDSHASNETSWEKKTQQKQNNTNDSHTCHETSTCRENKTQQKQIQIGELKSPKKAWLAKSQMSIESESCEGQESSRRQPSNKDKEESLQQQSEEPSSQGNAKPNTSMSTDDDNSVSDDKGIEQKNVDETNDEGKCREEGQEVEIDEAPGLVMKPGAKETMDVINEVLEEVKYKKRKKKKSKSRAKKRLKMDFDSVDKPRIEADNTEKIGSDSVTMPTNKPGTKVMKTKAHKRKSDDSGESEHAKCSTPKQSHKESDDARTPVLKIDDEIDKTLEENADKNNLTAINVKTILHHVITNEHVLAMVRNTMRDLETQDEGEPAAYEPKMTRSKIKEVTEKGGPLPVPWPISPLKQVSVQKPPQFKDLDFSDSDSTSDEDYKPEEEEERESDYESIASSHISEFGSPAPMTPFTPSSVITDQEMYTPTKVATETSTDDGDDGDDVGVSALEQGKKTDDEEDEESNDKQERHVKAAVVPMGPPPPKLPLKDVQKAADSTDKTSQLTQEEKDLIAYRTRSKLPLKDTPLDLIEANFVAPDITTDMYETNCDDDEWKEWLASLTKDIDGNDAFDDEQNDPEYNFLAEDEPEDIEDFRNDRAVQITKKEVNELLDELLETYGNEDLYDADMIDDVLDDEEPFNVPPAITFAEPLSSFLSQQKETAEMKLKEQFEKRQKKEPSLSRRSQENVLPTITLNEREQLKQQLQQHVQLLCQVYVMCQGQSNLAKEATQCRVFVTELDMFANRNEETLLQLVGQNQFAIKSDFRVTNLQDGLQIVNMSGPRSVFADENGGRKREGRGWTLPSISDWAQEIIATHEVFMYPELLPICGIAKSVNKKVTFAEAEDNLLALGLHQFKDCQNWAKLIAQNMLPVKKVEQIKIRVKNLSAPRAKDNIVKLYKRHHTLPTLPVFIESVVDGCQVVPLHLPGNRKPEWLKTYEKQQEFKRIKEEKEKQEKEEKERMENRDNIGVHEDSILVNEPGHSNRKLCLPALNKGRKPDSFYQQILGAPELNKPLIAKPILPKGGMAMVSNIKVNTMPKRGKVKIRKQMPKPSQIAPAVSMISAMPGSISLQPAVPTIITVPSMCPITMANTTTVQLGTVAATSTLVTQSIGKPVQLLPNRITEIPKSTPIVISPVKIASPPTIIVGAPSPKVAESRMNMSKVLTPTTTTNSDIKSSQPAIQAAAATLAKHGQSVVETSLSPVEFVSQTKMTHAELMKSDSKTTTTTTTTTATTATTTTKTTSVITSSLLTKPIQLVDNVTKSANTSKKIDTSTCAVIELDRDVENKITTKPTDSINKTNSDGDKLKQCDEQHTGRDLNTSHITDDIEITGQDFNTGTDIKTKPMSDISGSGQTLSRDKLSPLDVDRSRTDAVSDTFDADKNSDGVVNDNYDVNRRNTSGVADGNINDGVVNDNYDVNRRNKSGVANGNINNGVVTDNYDVNRRNTSGVANGNISIDRNRPNDVHDTFDVDKIDFDEMDDNDRSASDNEEETNDIAMETSYHDTGGGCHHEGDNIDANDDVLLLDKDDVGDDNTDSNPDINLMKPKSSTASIRSKRVKTKFRKDLESTIMLLQPGLIDKDMSEEKDNALAQAFLTRVKEVLWDKPNNYKCFLEILCAFGENKQPIAELYGKLELILNEWPGLIEDFTCFLTAEQALECGLFMSHLEFLKARTFLREIEIYFQKQPNHYQKILKVFKQWGGGGGEKDYSELKNTVLPLLRGQPHLEQEFMQLMPTARPSESHMTDFEEINWEDRDDYEHDGFEEIELPESDEEKQNTKNKLLRKTSGKYDPWKLANTETHGTRECQCHCHQSSHDPRVQRKARHCVLCNPALQLNRAELAKTVLQARSMNIGEANKKKQVKKIFERQLRDDMTEDEGIDEPCQEVSETCVNNLSEMCDNLADLLNEASDSGSFRHLLRGDSEDNSQTTDSDSDQGNDSSNNSCEMPSCYHQDSHTTLLSSGIDRSATNSPIEYSRTVSAETAAEPASDRIVLKISMNCSRSNSPILKNGELGTNDELDANDGSDVRQDRSTNSECNTRSDSPEVSDNHSPGKTLCKNKEFEHTSNLMDGKKVVNTTDKRSKGDDTIPVYERNESQGIGDSTPVAVNDNAEVTAKNSADVKVNDSAEVTAKNSADVKVNDSAEVTAKDSAEVTAKNSVEVKVNDSAEVTVKNSAEVNVNDRAEVTVKDNAEVKINDSAEVTVKDNAEVKINDSAEVTVKDSAEVKINDSTEVTVKDNAEVKINDSAEVTVKDNAEVKINDSAEVTVKDNAEVKINDSAEVTVKDSAEVTVSDSAEVKANDSVDAVNKIAEIDDNDTEINSDKVTVDNSKVIFDNNEVTVENSEVTVDNSEVTEVGDITVDESEVTVDKSEVIANRGKEVVASTEEDSENSTLNAKNISKGEDGRVTITWTRDDDRLLLQYCQTLGPTQETYQRVADETGGNKTAEQVEERFQILMQLFQEATENN